MLPGGRGKIEGGPPGMPRPGAHSARGRRYAWFRNICSLPICSVTLIFDGHCTSCEGSWSTMRRRCLHPSLRRSPVPRRNLRRSPVPDRPLESIKHQLYISDIYIYIYIHTYMRYINVYVYVCVYIYIHNAYTYCVYILRYTHTHTQSHTHTHNI
jgi:hypothetical protein